MHEFKLNNWEEFEEQLKKLNNERQQKKLSEFLYRGQGDKKWNLSTSLERNGNEKLSLKKYHQLISRVRPQIESFTGVKWNILSYPQGIEKWLNDSGSSMPPMLGISSKFLDTYGYMVYLRHYGFPSPLLDWSASPYIAAYFAFTQASKDIDFVSIYVYLESTSEIGLKVGDSNEAGIFNVGPYVRTDKRHFLQQCQYTVCIIHDNDEWRYESHENAFARGDMTQDVLQKFNIPYSERLKVLKLLDGYNINALSLFGSEESLMETMSLREIHFRNH